MANYRINITRSAAKEIEQIDGKKQRRLVVRRISKLSDEPRPPGCSKLSGKDLYRIRQGRYRILYRIDDDVLTVLVVKVGHRRDVYR